MLDSGLGSLLCAGAWWGGCRRAAGDRLTFLQRGFGQLKREMSLSSRAGKLQKGHL